jgi:hypothetical protein
MIGTTHHFEDLEAENKESGPMDVEHHSIAREEDIWGDVDDVPSNRAPNASTSDLRTTSSRYALQSI